MQNLKLSKGEVKKVLYVLYLLLAMFFGYFFEDISDSSISIINNREPSLTVSSTSSIYLGSFKVNRVVDGDTIHVIDKDGKEDIVRLLSINTPEVRNASDRQMCLGKIATNYTESKILNKEVLLFADGTQGNRDKYDRLLAYVALGTSTTYFNQELIETGNAKVFYTKPATVMHAKYLELEKQAKVNSIGMWNPELCK